MWTQALAKFGFWLVLAALPLAAHRAGAQEADSPRPATNTAALSPAALEALADTKAAAVEAQDDWRPKVVSLTPPNGSQAVEPNTELRIRFDRPMDPMAFKLNWRSGGFVEAGDPRYDSNRFEFAFPVRLAPGCAHRIVLNDPLLGITQVGQSRQQFPLEGFHSTDHGQAALVVWQFQTGSARSPGKSTPPKPVAISPRPGSVATLLTFIDIQFDQPMLPPAEAFPWLGSQTDMWHTASMIARVQYNPSNYTFRVPVLLPSREIIRFKVMKHYFAVPHMLTPMGTIAFTLEGFRSARGVDAAPIPLQYRVNEVNLADTEEATLVRGASDPRLLALLSQMKQHRTQLRSLAERVQTIEIGRKEALLVAMDSKSAEFRMQLPNRFYGDVSEEMLSCRIFRMGSDGHDWWFQFDAGNNTNLTVCPVEQMHIQDLSLADPFGLLSNTVAQAASSLRLNYVGSTNVAGVNYHLVEAWNVQAPGSSMTWGGLAQWWIDARDFRLAELVQFHNSGVLRTRFFYETLNQPLPAEMFALPSLPGTIRKPPETLDAGYTQRLVIIHDGADGRMSERWGTQGPKGMSSGGLN